MLAAAALAGPPKPASSEWFVTRSMTFMIQDGGVQYVLALDVRKSLTAPVYVTVDFENPQDPESPYFVETTLEPGKPVFEVRSESIKRIENRRTYLVKVWVYEDARRRTLLGTHEQKVQFKLPGALLRATGVEAL